MSEHPPIRREVLVDAAPEAAFEIFTAGMGRWWPLAAGKGVYCDGTVTFADGQIIERSAGGQQALWGTVTRWEPPAVVAFTWHPGREADRTSQVEVTFTAAGCADAGPADPLRVGDLRRPGGHASRVRQGLADGARLLR